VQLIGVIGFPKKGIERWVCFYFFGFWFPFLVNLDSVENIVDILVISPKTDNL